MVSFYTSFLGARITHRNPQLAFLTYDDEHHRIALVNMPDISNKVRGSAGLEHVAFTFASLRDLLGAYKQRLQLEEPVRPVWCVNHRVTMSLYYKDVDGNLIETQVDMFGDDAEKANQVMESELFAANPIGHDIDPEDLWRQLEEDGEEVVMERLRNAKETGEGRGIDSIPSEYME